jgi:adenylyltransferase/sulfurtransferase
MNDAQLQRYSRHLLLAEIDAAGQGRLLKSRALIIGLGGLGSPAALYLAASGVGSLVLSDQDTVELSNLQRQILHATDDLGRNKADSAADAVRALNPDVRVAVHTSALQGEHLNAEVARADVVLDCTDNFLSRQRINSACHALRKPLVSGAALRMAGQLTSFRFDRSPAPCYRCLYPYQDEDQENCSQAGILGPLTGAIGSLQAIEALKILLDFGETLQGRLLQLDARTLTWRHSILKPDPGCPVCAVPRAAGAGS